MLTGLGSNQSLERPEGYLRRRSDVKSRSSRTSSSSSSICSKSGHNGGIVKVEFEANVFRSSTFLRVTEHTTVQQVLQMALKKAELQVCTTRHNNTSPFVLLGLFTKNKKWKARTLKSTERIHDLLSSCDENDNQETKDGILKYLLKDTRTRPFDIDSMPLEDDDEGDSNNTSNDDDNEEYQICKFSDNTGIYRGCLMKQSKADVNVWHSRWFILQDDHLLYCRAFDRQANAGRIWLLNAKIEATVGSKKKDAYEFIIACKDRKYHLYASTPDEKIRWVAKIEMQIRITDDAEGFLAAENAINSATKKVCRKEDSKHPLHGILQNFEYHGLFRKFMKSDEDFVMYSGWIQCERFRTTVNRIMYEGDNTCCYESWKLAKKILDDTLPKIISTQGAFSTRVLNLVDLSEIRLRSQKEMLQYRIKLATSDSDYSTGTTGIEKMSPSIPDPEAFSDLQSQLFNLLAAKRGPYERFLESIQFAKVTYNCLPR